MPYPFEATFSEVAEDLDGYVDAVFGALESEFLVMPKGDGFVEFPTFDSAYEALKRVTEGFRVMDVDTVVAMVLEKPLCLVVLRCMLGLTPPEWAYHASRYSDVSVSQGAARSLDRAIRIAPDTPVSKNAKMKRERIRALVESACRLLAGGSRQAIGQGEIHRLDKADTEHGLESVAATADLGAPYAVLLYERLLGRPFASHRDSVSELVGNLLENAIEEALSRAKISYTKTKRADQLPGFDQTPDFVIPNQHNVKVVIEAKLSEDDGTARDKVTRIQHLAELSAQAAGAEGGFQVVACIAGRGFGVRREDMKKLLLATRGKVFTLNNIGRLVDCTKLSEYRTARIGGDGAAT